MLAEPAAAGVWHCSPNGPTSVRGGTDKTGQGLRCGSGRGKMVTNRLNFKVQKRDLPKLQKFHINIFWKTYVRKNTLQIEDHEKQFWFGCSLNLKTTQIDLALIFNPSNGTPKILQKYSKILIWNLVFYKHFTQHSRNINFGLPSQSDNSSNTSKNKKCIQMLMTWWSIKC